MVFFMYILFSKTVNYVFFLTPTNIKQDKLKLYIASTWLGAGFWARIIAARDQIAWPGF